MKTLSVTRPVVAVGLAVVAVALSGCISLLPKSKPAQLYRFGVAAQDAPATTAPSAGGAFGVLKPPAAFQREAAGDRILTATGTQVAYIGDARWVAPAQVLFDEAVTQAFAADNGAAQIQSRGDPRKSDYTLRLTVRSFEARYTHGANAAPEITITIDAALARPDRTVARQTTFTATVAASENRVGPIVDAFDQALDGMLPKLAQWVDAVGPLPES